MSAELNEIQRAVLRLLCDTFFPSIKVSDDPNGFWARAASDLGVDRVLATALVEDVPPKQRTVLLELLDTLVKQGFVNASQEERERILDRIRRSSPAAGGQVTFFEKQTLLLTYGLPESPVPNQNVVTYGSPQGQNPNWEIVGYPGPVSVPPKQPEESIKPLVPQGDATTLEADVCIVGSGAGGAAIAAKLSKQGWRVVILEAGGHYTAVDFHQLELWGYKHLWYRGGATPTSNGTVNLLAGGSLGGGTEINWMNCVRTPDVARQDWARNYGLDGIDTPEFDRYMDEVEKRISSSTENSFFNSANLRMREGCAKLNYLSRQTHTNWDSKLFQPLMAGYTGFGDQTGGKQTARRTFLVDAYQNGARIIVHCRADRVLVEQGRAAGVEATYSDPQGRKTKVTVRAPQVVVACGSLESPALLLRSGIGGPNVGKYLRVQPGGAVYGLYKEKQKGWWGSPMTTNCEQFTNTGDGFGFYMEIPAFGPGFVASVIPWSTGRQHKELMTKVPYISTFIWFLRDQGSGQITIDGDGESVSTYQLTHEGDQKNFRHATAEAIRIHEAAGAQEILFSLSHSQITWKRGQDLDDFIRQVQKQPLLDGAQPMISAHQLCTCRMGKDPSISVANTSGELYDVKGVWIGDASACPTSLGANPMITIMALAQRTADKMMAALPRRTGIASAAVVGTASPVSERSSTMFCHIIELTAKPGQARRAVEIIGNQAIPTVIQPAEGFVDEIVLLSLSDPNHVTAFSFWQNKDYSDKFDAYGFDAVTVMVQETLAAPPERRPFDVGASTNPRIQGWVRIPPAVGRANGPVVGAPRSDLGGITDLAANMFQGMVGVMTNPMSMFTLGERILSGTAGQASAAQPGGAANSTMFCHIIELTAKPGQARKVVEIIGEQAIPTIIQPAEGFVDEIVLLSQSDPNHVTAFSFWENKDYSDKFDAYGFNAVTVLVQDVLAAPPERRPFDVGASTNPRIHGWTTRPPVGPSIGGMTGSVQDLGSLSAMAGNMFQGMLGIITNPMSIFSLGNRLLSASGLSGRRGQGRNW